jgi:CDP-diacylglycerol--glycerol-3-phosphate 3-phosphatidyltransferase/cardiolipin synthase
MAKWKTFVQIVALGFLIAGPAGESILPGTVDIGLALLWLAALLTLYTGWDYMKAGIKHTME